MDNIKLLNSYENGNCYVSVFSNGSKIRHYYDEIPHPKYPESIDLKITNQCDLNCKYCHENSVYNGKHADLWYIYEKLKKLPRGVEIAIGGGNPLCNPQLESFLRCLKDIGLIANITVNIIHAQQKKYAEMLDKFIKEELIYGIGISGYGKLEFKSDNIVWHLIAGVNDYLLDLIIKEPNQKVLILGYKKIRRGGSYFSDEVQNRIDKLYSNIHKYFGKALISFDNLAISQLNIKRFFTEKHWNEIYMGDDGEFTLYIDGVKKEIAKSSVSADRKKLKEIILDF